MNTLILALELSTAPVLDQIADALERDKIRVHRSRTSVGAHEAVPLDRPDVVLAEHWLEARGAGWRLIEELSWDPRTNAIPIVVASGWHAVDHERDPAKELDSVIIDEPVDLDIVLNWIQDVLSIRDLVLTSLPDQRGSKSPPNEENHPRAA